MLENVSAPVVEEMSSTSNDSVAFFENSTRAADAVASSFSMQVGIAGFVIIIVLSAVSIFCNAMIIVAVAKSSLLQEPAHLLIGNLAIADLLITLSILTIYPNILRAEATGEWAFYVCAAALYIPVFTETLSFLTIIAITTDRYLAIVRPLRYPAIATRRRVKILIALFWALAVAAVTSAIFDTNFSGEHCDLLYTLGSTSATLAVALYVAVVVTMVIAYAHIAAITVRHIKQVAPGESVPEFDKQVRLAKVLMMIVGTFVLLWLPLNVTLVIRLVHGETTEEPRHEGREQLRQVVVFNLAFLNSVADPVIYAFMSADYRHAVKELLRSYLNRG